MFSSSDVFLCLGRRKSGKSHLARKLSHAYPRKVIFDTLGEYSDRDGLLCSSFEEFSKNLIATERDSEFTLIYQFDIEKDQNVVEFNEALRCLFYRGNLLILVEEIQNFSSPHSMCLWLKNSLLIGRHRNLALLFTTQRPGECHKTIVSQANHVFCGSLHEKNDLEYVRTVLGDHAYRLINIPERQFLYFQPGKSLQHIDNDLNLLKAERPPSLATPMETPSPDAPESDSTPENESDSVNTLNQT